ncbi:MAG: hypothetical protein CL678_11640 [Bdellovibrionaceae bacterium]|nr:hypothetical protein [Pseudobdellovibrionaceae bacterium]|tara:strand:- start:4134 stop:4892 length:759 start_codon:yes stop_codon:yes gene_type:complete
MKITIDQYYLITIDRIYKHRKHNIEDIKSIIKKNTNKSVIQTGVDGMNLTPEIISTLQKKKILKYNLEIPNFSRILSNSEIGLNLTEYKIYKHMIKNNIQYAIIFEDDAKINEKTFFDDLKNITEDCPEDFLFISMFHHPRPSQQQYIKTLKKYNQHILFSKGQLYGTVCYIISLKGAKAFLQNIFPINMPIDVAIWQYCETRGGRYISNKSLAQLSDNKSFINSDRNISVMEGTMKFKKNILNLDNQLFKY